MVGSEPTDGRRNGASASARSGSGRQGGKEARRQGGKEDIESVIDVKGIADDSLK
jgi:hypothetical protein